MLKDYWPYPSFRDGQEEVLNAIQDSIENYDVTIIRAPTAFGKAPTSVAVQNFCLANGLSAAITVPNNVLREQNISNFSHLKTVRAMDDYWLEKYQMSEKQFRKSVYRWGPKDSEYNADLKACKRVGEPICVNYYSYIAHKLQRNVVIVDEAHLLLGTLQDFAAKRIWKHKVNYPNTIRTLAQLKKWVDSQSPVGPLKRLKTELDSLNPATLIQVTYDRFRGENKPCIKLIPMSVESSPPIFWPTKTEKIVLFSATLGPADVDMMGLGTRSIKWIDAPSPIEPARRGIHKSFVGNMSYATQDQNLDALVSKIKQLRDNHEGNGFVHASYSLAQKLQSRLSNEPWAMFHGRDNKQDVYDKFSETTETGLVMIGSGMSEGVSMDYGIASWQAIAKIPYPSLGDPAMRWVASNNSDYYNWMVSKDVMQAAGRVCRAPDDYGVTYILDNAWDRWYNKVQTTLPKWFREAIQ